MCEGVCGSRGEGGGERGKGEEEREGRKRWRRGGERGLLNRVVARLMVGGGGRRGKGGRYAVLFDLRLDQFESKFARLIVFFLCPMFCLFYLVIYIYIITFCLSEDLCVGLS